MIDIHYNNILWNYLSRTSNQNDLKIVLCDILFIHMCCRFGARPYRATTRSRCPGRLMVPFNCGAWRTAPKCVCSSAASTSSTSPCHVTRARSLPLVTCTVPGSWLCSKWCALRSRKSSARRRLTNSIYKSGCTKREPQWVFEIWKISKQLH